MSQKQTFTDKCFKDKNGQVVLAQAPNAPIVIWAVATLGAKLFDRGVPHHTLVFIAYAAILIWATLEIFAGTNYLRRALGVIVLLLSIWSLLN